MVAASPSDVHDIWVQLLDTTMVLTLLYPSMSGQGGDIRETRLKSEMGSQGISIAALSLRTGVSLGLIARYRSGKVVPRDHFGRPSKNAFQIARVLGIDVDELFPPRERAAA